MTNKTPVLNEGLDFLVLVHPLELRREIRQILLKLQLLSEVSAPRIGRRSQDSEKPPGPPGFRNLSQAQEPPADRSLYEHYRFAFAAAVATGEDLWRVLWEAEQDHRVHVLPPSPDERAERIALRPERSGDEQAERQFANRVVNDYEGEHVYRVHLRLNVAQGWIEKVRMEADRDPIWGLRRPDWKNMSAEEKAQMVWSCRKDNLSQDDCAKRLGVSRRTIATYWRKAA